MAGVTYTSGVGGKRADLDGLYLRSRWEANYARYLNLLKANGSIQDWAYEPETFTFEGIKRGCRFYTPDFRIANIDGSIVYHEVKGFMDAKSATKLKRMAKYFPKIQIVLIEKKEITEIERKFAAMLPHWEYPNKRIRHYKPRPRAKKP